MKFLIICVLAMTGVLVSCGEENPLAGKPRGVQDGKDPQSGEKPQVDNEESLRVETQVEDFDFVEENTGKYVIEGKIFIPGAVFKLRAENLTDFPGATFDEVTGVFEWTPPAGFVNTLEEKKIKLNILMYTTNQAVVRRKNKAITVKVNSSREVPTIESISFDDSNIAMREGEMINMSIVIRDITGLDVDKGRPTIFISVANASYPYDPEDAAIVGFRNTVPDQDPQDKALWTYRMKVDLRNREITTTKKYLTITAMALSRFNIPSREDDLALTVFSSLKQPTITWSGVQQFNAGAKNSFAYSVFDPRGEGEPLHKLLTNCATIHPNLKCGNCISINDPGVGTILTCPVSWNIPSDYFTAGGRSSISLDIQLSAKSKASGDSFQTPEYKISRTIQVLPPDVVISGGK